MKGRAGKYGVRGIGEWQLVCWVQVGLVGRVSEELEHMPVEGLWLRRISGHECIRRGSLTPISRLPVSTRCVTVRSSLGAFRL